jgi:DHA2 family multidrug resistance protein-like MFS transporter
VIALPCVLYAMDLTVLNLAVPHLTADLKPSAAQLLWIVDIYGFLVAGCLITMGNLGDRIGRRRLLLIGAGAFGVGSVLAAFAPTAELLIVARALLGVAGATLAPSTLSLIRNMFQDESERTFAIGMWAMSYSAGGRRIGPLLAACCSNISGGGLGVPATLALAGNGAAARGLGRGCAGIPRSAVGRPRHSPAPGCRLPAVLLIHYGAEAVAEGCLDAAPRLSRSSGLAVGVRSSCSGSALGRIL